MRRVGNEAYLVFRKKCIYYTQRFRRNYILITLTITANSCFSGLKYWCEFN